MTSVLSRSHLEGSWHVLDAGHVDGLSSLPLSIEGVGDIRIAVDSDRSRHLLVPTRSPLHGWSQVDSPLKDSVRALVLGGHPRVYLDIRCVDDRLFETFDDLILDVLESIAPSDDPGAAVASALDRWRMLFRAMGIARLGRELRYGLFAELLVLEICALSIGLPSVDCWRGPFGEPHDFELARACIEVKAAGMTSDSVTFHGFEQLQPDRGVPLELLVFVLAESSDGRTIPELIASIEDVTEIGALDSMLSKIGFDQSTPIDRLVIADSFALRIDDRVPSLTGSTVAPVAIEGISRVSYDIPFARLTQLGGGRSTIATIERAIS